MGPLRDARHATRSLAAALLLPLLAIAAVTFSPTQVWADGDPASDVLLAQDVFYPYEPKIAHALEAALEKTLRVAALEAGLHLKVAIIASPQELGLVPKLFGHPQAYAQFLDREISFNQPQQLLVVMPAGFGAMPASLANGLAGVPIDNQGRSSGLTRSAVLAVAALARSQGHPIATPSVSASSSGGSPPALLVYGLPALLVAALAFALTRRARSPSEGEPPEGGQV